MADTQFVLASASAARRRLLIEAGIQPFVCPSNFDEDAVVIRDPQELVKVLASGKAEAVAPQFSNALVLGCDSVLAINGITYGKPESEAEAIDRWRQMRGGSGELHTGYALIAPGREPLVRSRMTRVFFAHVSDAEIEAYIATGEPMHCAGAFATDGKGSMFVEKIEGCHTNVVGLSIPLLRQMMAELGYRAIDFWGRT
ncbi:MAG: septum formation inhibitor Maf [Phormidesmis sp. RL_2_1]|nr:septum formation inhibitor Maf [Phormidesmis sp. RL_2_1]